MFHLHPVRHKMAGVVLRIEWSQPRQSEAFTYIVAIAAVIHDKNRWKKLII